MVRIIGKSQIGTGTYIGQFAVIGHPGKDEMHLLMERKLEDISGARIGKMCIIRDFTVIYSNVILEDRVQTGHFVLVREHTKVGERSLIGTSTIIEDHCTIGKNVSIQSGVYVPTNSVIEDDVFIGPHAVFTNDKYMALKDVSLRGPIIKRGARIGANSTILPGIIVGEDAVVGAGSVVTKDVEPREVVVGMPAASVKKVDEL